MRSCLPLHSPSHVRSAQNGEHLVLDGMQKRATVRHAVRNGGARRQCTRDDRGIGRSRPVTAQRAHLKQEPCSQAARNGCITLGHCFSVLRVEYYHRSSSSREVITLADLSVRMAICNDFFFQLGFEP